jgi:hypothetical protein
MVMTFIGAADEPARVGGVARKRTSHHDLIGFPRLTAHSGEQGLAREFNRRRQSQTSEDFPLLPPQKQRLVYRFDPLKRVTEIRFQNAQGSVGSLHQSKRGPIELNRLPRFELSSSCDGRFKMPQQRDFQVEDCNRLCELKGKFGVRVLGATRGSILAGVSHDGVVRQHRLSSLARLMS